VGISELEFDDGSRSTSESVVILKLCIQLLRGGDDSCHRVDDEAFLCHTSICHLAVGTCIKTDTNKKYG